MFFFYSPLKTAPFNASNGFYQIESNAQSDGVPLRRALGTVIPNYLLFFLQRPAVVFPTSFTLGGTCFGGMSLPTPQQVKQVVGTSNYFPTSTNWGFGIEL